MVFPTVHCCLKQVLNRFSRLQLRLLRNFRRLDLPISWDTARCLPHWWCTLQRFWYPRALLLSSLLGLSTIGLGGRCSRLRRHPPGPSQLYVSAWAWIGNSLLASLGIMGLIRPGLLHCERPEPIVSPWGTPGAILWPEHRHFKFWKSPESLSIILDEIGVDLDWE